MIFGLRMLPECSEGTPLGLEPSEGEENAEDGVVLLGGYGHAFHVSHFWMNCFLGLLLTLVWSS